ncbi:MAG: 4Fe-4S binding protein [Flavobacteriales bacterium]|nr:4Fe-4S binding protein [Flavobacteriales bacterium]
MDTVKRRPYAKWRMASLVGVHVLFIAHFVHWKLKGRTLAPLEFNEVLYTIHQGIVTAGFILMALVMVATLVFGRFFCSWGCHFLALQDTAGWLMDKLRIKRQPIRSRTLIWVPIGVMFYLFIWPQFLHLWHGVEAAQLQVVGTGTSRWSSFSTDDLWRNLPPPGVAVLTFFICGFLIVYLLGSRGFCYQACPYGALFSLADQLAPGRIVLAKDCSQCGLCTKACSSDILVHRELAMHGMVTNPRCLKDLDCVAACPENAVQYGFRLPPLFRKGHPMGSYGGRYGFSLGEDLFMLAMFGAGLLVYRGLYDAIPFLLAVALGLCTAFLLVMGLRLMRQGAVQLRGVVLKMDRRLRPAGSGFVAVLAAVLVFFLHSAFIQYHTLTGRRMFQEIADGAADAHSIDRAIAHYSVTLGRGLLAPMDRKQELAALYLMRGDRASAQHLLEDIVSGDPHHIEAHYRLGVIARDGGDPALAMVHWRQALDRGTLRAGGRDHELVLRAALDLGAALESNGAMGQAHDVYLLGMERLPGSAELFIRTAAVESRMGMEDQAILHYEQALQLAGGTPVLYNNLGALYLRKGMLELARPHFQRLAEITPEDVRVRYTLGVLNARTGRTEEAREQLGIALRLDPADQRSATALAALNKASMRSTEQAR